MQKQTVDFIFYFTQLTPEKVASGLKVLLSKETGRNAKKLAIQMNTENGVNTSLDSFYSHIHLEDMICDVSIFHGESRVAQVWCRQCRFKMNKEVCDIIHDSSNTNNIKVYFFLDPHLKPYLVHIILLCFQLSGAWGE
jgi:hypothetical protein